LGPVDLIICGFPCQGFSRASRRAQGLRDPRSSVFFDMVNLIHEITYTHGNCGWLIENVDASDHTNALVRDEFNRVVKGVLKEGYAFDAVAVGSYAHRFRRFWTNLIPTTLLHSMVEKQFASRSPDQSVQDILEPDRKAQLASHDRAPGPHSVNVVGEPLKAFSTFVTLKRFDAYRSHAQSLVYSALRKLEAPSLLEKERAMGFLGGMSQVLSPPLNEFSCLRLLEGSMDLFQLTFLFGSIFAFQKGLLALRRFWGRQPTSMGQSVPIRLPTITRHELTHLARTDQLQSLLSGISDTQASVNSDVSPSGRVGMPSEETSARSAQENKIEQSRTVKVDGVQGKAVVKEFRWPINENLPPGKITALEEILDEFRDVFAFDASELGFIEGETYHIKLTDETPIFKQQALTAREGDTSGTNGGKESGRFYQNFYF
jgi:hypothetical protein